MSKKEKFRLKSEYKPAGDQPGAIKALVDGLKAGKVHQTLLGVTGSGKTFTVANVIDKIQKPTLVIAHNKTLAAQLAQEYKEFFPNNAVHYFVSYYDYYQPEAYMPITDTYIEKDAQINDEIDRLRHASTQALLTRNDVIIVASVSCIYGIGTPEEYEAQHLKLKVGEREDRRNIIERLVNIYFERTTGDLTPGTFRAIANTIEIMPVSEKEITYRIEFSGGRIDTIFKMNAITREILSEEINIFLFPAKHFVTPKDQRNRAMKLIKNEMEARTKELTKEGREIDAERLRRRTRNDLAMIREVGYCSGIENYSRHLSGRKAGEAPDTLLSYFPHKKDGSADFLTIIDESHVTIPQIGGMYAGDRSRKQTLVEYGFRLPSALDNRPLQFKEFKERVGQSIYTSATPGTYEFEHSDKLTCQAHSKFFRPENKKNAKHIDEKGGNGNTKECAVVEQIIRPTGLVDPEIAVKPVIEKGSYKGQIADLISEAEKEIKKGGRVIATTLTKKMAEDLSVYLKEKGIKAEYLHSEIKTIDRIKILTEFRKGKFDCIVGVNLLREGLDLPEVTLIGILDADKEGFLRSETALIQIIGRAARNVNGRVILYADSVTGSMERALNETSRRRKLQLTYNKKHKITPKTIIKKIHDITEQLETAHEKAVHSQIEIDKKILEKYPERLLKQKEKQMNAAAKFLDFETAALLRDEISIIEKVITIKNKKK